MDSKPRTEVLSLVAAGITALTPGHPVRVGVEGMSGAGKSMLADELAPIVASRGRPAVRATIDDFHTPGHKYRSMRGEYSPQTRYSHSYDYAAVAEVLLDPLGPGGDARVRLGTFDSFHDIPLAEEWTLVDPDAVVIVDGVFLGHPRIRDRWDYRVWLEVDDETSIRRARARDIAWVGDADEVERRYRAGALPAHRYYESETGARDLADIVIDNREPAWPVLLRGSR